MEAVFHSDNPVEAHMIIHLLERTGIQAEIMGEHLQGGVGELPAHGNIRVVVEAQDAERAKTLISEWEAEQRVSADTPTQRPRNNYFSGLAAFLAGAAVASVFLLWAYNTPIETHTADYNRDGEVDEWAYWRGNNVSRIDIDRNHDGNVDQRFHYSPRNSLEQAEADNNFDGRFEYVSEYRFAQPYLDEIDIDGDGQIDYRQHYVDGVLTQVEMLASSGRTVRKSQTYKNGVTLIEARWDSDNDGVLDTLIVYGPFEEEISRSPISRDE